MDNRELAGGGVEYVGPFQTHRVVVDGWRVPLLEAHPRPGGQVSLVLDERFGLELSLQDAERVVPFIANAIAIAGGYSAHPSGKAEEPRERSPLAPRRLLRLDWGEPEETEALG